MASPMRPDPGETQSPRAFAHGLPAQPRPQRQHRPRDIPPTQYVDQLVTLVEEDALGPMQFVELLRDVAESRQRLLLAPPRSLELATAPGRMLQPCDLRRPLL